MTIPQPLRNPWCWLVFGLVVVLIRGLFIPLMDVDASQYASIGMEMLQRGHWLQVQYRGADYLDKPPLLFWTSSLSFALFGLRTWAYKLPSLIAAAAGVLAVYRLSLLYYARGTARNAAFILASSVGFVLMNNDVRTDALLMGMTACAVWQSAEYLESSQILHLLFTGVFVGLAMLAKGPIGAVMPAFAIVSHLLLRRNWRAILNWRWILALLVAAVILLPMCWGLYQQFDRHPEKVVNGAAGVSGVRFFFWDQSFGRITGSNLIRNDTSVLTFLHDYLWIFLPWTVLFAGALWHRFSELIRNRLRNAAHDEGFSIGGFALTFVALSLSHYRLPHYIFITLPWAAILTARWMTVTRARGWWIAQYGVFGLLAAVVVWLLTGGFPPGHALIWLMVVAGFGGIAVTCVRRPFPAQADALVRRTVLAGVITFVVLNFHFYPRLLTYQSTSVAPRVARQFDIPLDKLAFYNWSGPALDFYSGRTLSAMASPVEVRDSARQSNYWLYTDSVGRARLDSAGVRYRPVVTLQHFQVALLTGTFVNASTRRHALVPVYLLEIPRQ